MEHLIIINGGRLTGLMNSDHEPYMLYALKEYLLYEKGSTNSSPYVIDELSSVYNLRHDEVWVSFNDVLNDLIYYNALISFSEVSKILFMAGRLYITIEDNIEDPLYY